MARWPEKVERIEKFEVVYKDEDGEYIWKYDLKKFPFGPISVENKYTADYLKRAKSLMKETAAEKKYNKLKELHEALDKLKQTKRKKK